MRPPRAGHRAAARALAACAVAVAPVPAAPQASAAGDAFVLLDAWTVPTARGGVVPVALSFANGTLSDIDVVGVRSPNAELVAWREAAWPDGVARIGCGIRFRLPARETRRLLPPGQSLVLVGVTQALTAGDTISLDLALRDHPTLRLRVPVRPAPPLPSAPWRLTAACGPRPAGTPVAWRRRPSRRSVLRFAADRRSGQDDPAASDLDVGRRAERIDESVMSPYCPELTLAACPSDGAAILRAEVRQWLAAGWSESAIRASMHHRFGPVLDGAPAPRGLGALAWTLPFVVLILGGAGVAVWIRRDARRGPAAVAPTASDPASVAEPAMRDAALRARLDALVRTQGA